jgi:cytochrome bd-type quinol oxidase subunit 2
MELTILVSKIVGPVLILRAISILIDRDHFVEMVNGLQRETTTVAFSLFPIALVMACIALAVNCRDTSSLAGILILLMAWGGMLKGAALMLFPRLVAAKARLLVQSGFLNVVLLVCLAIGGYFTWFGYFGATTG